LSLEWNFYKLEELINLRTGKLDSNAEEENGNYPFFTCAPDPLKINSFSFNQKAILLAGNNANGNFHINYYEGKFDAYQRTYVIDVLDDEKIDLKFLYYALKICLSDFKRMSQGTSTRFLTKKILDNFEIQVPQMETQLKIVEILDNISNKIKTNQEINKNLEQLINTIFYNWFISFDKFKNLKFKNSELGDIPEEWNCGILRDILTLIKNPIKAAETNGLPYLPIDIIPMNSLGISELKSDEEANSSLITFDKNDILIGAMRVYFHRVVISPCFGVTRSTCFVLKPKKKEYLSYLLLLCNLDQTIQYAQNTSKGTTMPYAVWDNGLGDMDIIIPPDNVLKEFHVLVFPIIEKIRDSYNEINKLQKLRDTLLPKLMSGEIDVSKINCDLKNIIKTFIKKFKCILLKYYHERKIISKISLITLKFLFIFLLRFIKSSILSNIIAIFF